MILRITFLFVFFQTLVIAQVSEFPFEESSLLWKIEGPGIKKGAYLFGTMHLIEKEHFYFPDLFCDHKLFNGNTIQLLKNICEVGIAVV